MTEPNLDEQIHKAILRVGSFTTDEQQDIDIAELKALIANQVREARIDELRLIEQAQQDEDKWSLFCMDDTSDFGNYIAGRIKELGE